MAKKASTNQILIQKIEVLNGLNEVKIQLGRFSLFSKLAEEYMKVIRLHSQSILNKTKLKKFFIALDKENRDIGNTIESIGLNTEQFERPEFTDYLTRIGDLETGFEDEFPRKEGESDADYYREFLIDEINASNVQIDHYLKDECTENSYEMIESGYIYKGQILKEEDIHGVIYRGYYHRDGSFYGNYLEVSDFLPVDSYFRFIVDGKILSEKEFLKLKDKA